MTHDPDDDRLDALTDLIRNDPTTWPVAETMSDERMAELTEQAIQQGRQRRAAQRRRRRAAAAALGVGLAVTGGAVAAAFWSGQPDRPHAGVVCRAEARLDADAIVLPASEDPAGDCRDRWDAGAFAQFHATDIPQSLAVCVGTNGAIEVFPGDDACTHLGLPVADSDLSPDNQRILHLQERLVTDINLVEGCLTIDEATATAHQILQDLDLHGWTVVIQPDVSNTDCAKAGIGEDNRHVFISEL